MNREAYNRVAFEWDLARVAFCGRERDYVEALLEGLPERSAILDLGCGTGRPIAEFLLSRGHRVTGVDQAAELLAIARERFPQATWIEARLEDFKTLERYAAIVFAGIRSFTLNVRCTKSCSRESRGVLCPAAGS